MDFKKIAIIGAAGQISRMLINRLLNESDIEMVLAGRNVTKRVGINNERISYVDGDLSEIENTKKALKDVDVVYVNEASPDLLEPTIAIMKENNIRRLIVAGVLGIYDEVAGEFRKWNESMMGKWNPNSNIVKGASIVDNSGLDFTYLRMTWLYDEEGNVAYRLIPRGEEYRGAQVTRQAVVQYVIDLLDDKTKDLAVSLGIVEPGSENMAKPSFY